MQEGQYNYSAESLYVDAVKLLSKMIQIPSISKEEDGTAELLSSFLADKGVTVKRIGNNVMALNRYFDSTKPTILLNSHHDTVKPNSDYTRNPFLPIIEDGKLYGLGSNDAGASVVALISVFIRYFNSRNLKYNLCLLISAEEEISGSNGVVLAAEHLPDIDFAIVGEPTNMNMAIAERGLLVLDCVAHGKAGHAAREEGDNAIYKAIKDIEWFKTFDFERVSPTLGKQKMNVTMINAGIQHNVIPASCKFTVDVRVTECYTNEEVFDIIKSNVQSEVTPRSFRLRSSSIPIEHPVIQKGIAMGLKTFGSPTTSDQSLLYLTAVKMGVGDSSRSHSADEFIYLDEIKHGITTYINLLESLIL